MRREDSLREILAAVKAGRISEDEAVKELQAEGVDDLRFANIDYTREKRRGFPEVIYGEGKTAEEIFAIMEALLTRSEKSILATRVDAEKAAFVCKKLPEAVYEARARVLFLRRKIEPVAVGRKLLILTAGTSDIPVAEEAWLTAELMGIETVTHFDCGVAGIHRLFAHLADIRAASVILVCAGMEGALASVVGGLTSAPVLAVPTSVGYGASLGGVSALLAMLNSCASGVAVVNIDNGFGAAVMAAHILMAK